MAFLREKSYVIVTPARNEENYIEKTIKSVASQSLLPKKWIIVSDGSTDRTDIIVNEYSNKYDFIHLLRAEDDNKRNFGSKIMAFRAGVKQLTNLEYDFIGNLDADVSFYFNYYENLLQKFNNAPKQVLIQQFNL